MRRRFLIVITLSAVVNLALAAVLGFKQSNSDCDVSARGLIAWSDNRGQLGLPRGQWVTLEPAPEDADLPPCRLGTKPDQKGFRAV